jgi:hypothetical protein
MAKAPKRVRGRAAAKRGRAAPPKRGRRVKKPESREK